MRPAREPLPTFGPGLRFFRSLERGAGALLLLLSMPVLVILWVWVRLDSGGPALVRETRLGLGREPFEMLKFRSTERVDEPAPTPGRAKSRKKTSPPPNARVTRSGWILRRTGLDDLPQLWNVVRGDMSLVGPRPLRSEQLRALPPWVDIRFAVKPGITGLARVKNRSTLGWIDQLRWDRAFVQSDSARLRVSILLRTPFAVFQRRPASKRKGVRSWRAYLPRDD